MRFVLAIGLAFALAAAAVAQRPDPVQSRTILRPAVGFAAAVRTIRYRGADGVERPADLYVDPRKKGPRPTLVLVSGTDDARSWGGYRDFATLAAERGFAAVVPAKRFAPGGEGIAQGRADTRALLDQLEALAPDAVDRRRLCLWAFSAGGSTLSLAYGADAPPLACVIGYYPVLSLRGAASAPEDWLATYSPADAATRHGGPRSPPTLIVRAGRDGDAINRGIAAFTATTMTRNMPVTLVNLPEAQHAFDWLDDTLWTRTTMEASFAFARARTEP